MNLLRGDIARLGRCAAITTGHSSSSSSSSSCISSSLKLEVPLSESIRHDASASYRASAADIYDRKTPLSAAAAYASGCGGSSGASCCGSGSGATGCCSSSTSGSCRKDETTSPDSGSKPAPDASPAPPSASPPSSSFQSVPRCKPLKYCYEKEIVLYAYHKKLVYHATECLYSPQAYRCVPQRLGRERMHPSACWLNYLPLN